MIHATESTADILFCELYHSLEMIKILQADLNRGKETDGADPEWIRSDRGRRMTIRLIKERLQDIRLRMERGLKQNLECSHGANHEKQ